MHHARNMLCIILDVIKLSDGRGRKCNIFLVIVRHLLLQ